MAEPSDFLVRSFATLCLLTAAGLPLGVYAASLRTGSASSVALRNAFITLAAFSGWMAATFAAAASGALRFGPMPPPIAIVLLPMIAGAVILARSGVGQRLAAGLPLAALVGFQGFRLPLELIMHRAYTEGVMPEQMSYSGYNFDIVTGASALLVMALLLMKKMPLWGVRLWNWMGSLLLLNIVTIALLSTPTPVRVFDNEPANVWIAEAPFVWLPAVMVFLALVGHIVIFRRLRLESGAPGRVVRQP